VKIDNVPLARPHYGITQADMVFEILVEGFATRLAAVFHSQDPQTIGNIRSARLADRSLTPMVRGALVYSGTSAYEVPLIQGDAANGKYVDVEEDARVLAWCAAGRMVRRNDHERDRTECDGEHSARLRRRTRHGPHRSQPRMSVSAV
jgi:DUF3048 family protein